MSCKYLILNLTMNSLRTFADYNTLFSRGKKIFRKFSDVEGQGDDDSVDGLSSGHDLRRRIGHAATRPLTRASIKPRLLWPSKEEPAGDDPMKAEEEEEAPTDIEDPEITTLPAHSEDINRTHTIPSKSRPAHKGTCHALEQEYSTSSSKHTITKTSHHLHHGSVARSSTASRQTRRSELTDVYEDDPSSTSTSKRGLVYKASPFSAWSRTKAGQPSSFSKLTSTLGSTSTSTTKGKGTKRDVDVTELSGDTADAKRARSGNW